MKKLLLLCAAVLLSVVGCGGGGGGSTPSATPQTGAIAVKIAPENSSVAKGATLKFTAIGLLSDGTKQNLTEVVTWSSSSTAIATVNTGLATALDAGSTTITATVGGVSDSTVLTVTAKDPPFTSPSGWKLTSVVSDVASNVIIATGSSSNNAVALAFDSNGAILWQNSLPGRYGKSQVANGNLYAVRTLWSAGVGNTYLDKINPGTRMTTSVLVDTMLDEYGTTAFCGSLATSADATTYVAAANSTKQSSFWKFDSIGNQSFLLDYNSPCVEDMEVNEVGSYFYSISSQGMDAYTFKGVYFGTSPAPAGAQFNNTLAKNNVMYVSGSQAGIATLWIYDENNGGSQRSYPLGTGQAEGMVFGPSGEMYVAINNGLGPVRIDPTTGKVAWTGNTAGHSVAYLNGKVYLATGGDALKVFDSSTGEQRLD